MSILDSGGIDALSLHGAELVADADNASETLGLLVWLGQLGRDGSLSRSLVAGVWGPEQPVRKFGRFRLEGLLGTGAYGAVFRAFDPDLGCSVALKIAWPAILFDSEMSRRFVEEPHAIAAISHPGIVRVYESGSVEMARYISFELIEGPTLAEWIGSQEHIPVAVAAEIICQVAESVEFMHRRGVVHRDLKPSNILLRPLSERDEELSFQPVVTDFGLASCSQSAGRSDATATLAVLGTDRYMSPEQAAGQASEAGPASDVFSLGVILYELVAGVRPFEGESGEQVRGRIQRDDPPSIRGWRRNIAREVETIIFKCLEKLPERRYATAEALAEDLRRFLEGKPIVARPIPAWQRAWKLVRRNPRSTALAMSTVIAGLVASSLGGALLYQRITSERELTRERERAAAADIQRRERQYSTAIRGAADALGRTDMSQLASQLRHSEEVAHSGVPLGIEWRYLKSRSSSQHVNFCPNEWVRVSSVRFLPGDQEFLSVNDQGTLAVWRAEDGTKKLEVRDPRAALRAAELSPDGSLVALGDTAGRLIIRKLDSMEIVQEFQALPVEITSVTWLGDAKRVAAAGVEGELAIATLHDSSVKNMVVRHMHEDPSSGSNLSAIHCLTYNPQAGSLFVASSRRGVVVINPDTLEQTASWAKNDYVGRGMIRIDNDPEHVAILQSNRELQTLRTSTGATISRHHLQTDFKCACYCSATNTLFLAGDGGNIEAWHVLRHGTLVLNGRRALPDARSILSIDVSADGRRLVLGSLSGEIAVIDTERLRDGFDLEVPIRLWATEYSPCGRWLAIVHTDREGFGRLALHDARSGELNWTQRVGQVPPVPDAEVHPMTLHRIRHDYEDRIPIPNNLVPRPSYPPEARVAFSPDGDACAFSVGEEPILTFQTSSGKQLATYDPPASFPHDRIQYSPEGGRLIASSRLNGKAIGFDLESAAIVERHDTSREHYCGSVATSAGCFDLIAIGKDALCLRERRTQVDRVTLRGNEKGIYCAAVSPDGQTVAATSDGLIIYVWDIEAPGVPSVLSGHREAIVDLRFCSAGKTLLSRSRDGTVRFWHMPTRSELFSIGDSDEPYICLGVSPDESTLILGGAREGDHIFGWRYGIHYHRLSSEAALSATFDFGGSMNE